MFVGSIEIGYIVAISAAVLFVMARAYLRVRSTMEAVSQKNQNMERLLLDIRDKTKRFYLEKRLFPRVDTRGSVMVKIVRGECARYLSAVNISLGGALLRASTVFKQGEIIDLSVQLPLYAEPLFVTAQVVRVSDMGDTRNGYLVGTKFLAMRERYKERLAETIDILEDRKEIIS